MVMILLCGGSVGVGWYERMRGYQEGWIARSIDEFAVRDFLVRADELTDDTDETQLTAAWEETRAKARGLQKEWQQMAWVDQIRYPTIPFWETGGASGHPNRLTRAQRKEAEERLKKDPAKKVEKK